MAISPYFALSSPNLMCVHQCLHAHMLCAHTYTILPSLLLNKKKIALSDGLLFQHSMKEHFKFLTVSTDLNKTKESNKWILKITHISMTRASSEWLLKYRDSAKMFFSIYSIFTVFLINSCGPDFVPLLAQINSNTECVVVGSVCFTMVLLEDRVPSVI